MRGNSFKHVTVPSIVKDMTAVEVARSEIKEYFEVISNKHRVLDDNITPGTSNRLRDLK